MPRKNVVKQYVEDGYYHIYNRGVNKQTIFHTDDDYRYFLSLFERYLSATPQKNSHQYAYPWLHQDIEVLSFCLMSNHFHLLVKQKTTHGITQLMRCLATAYSMYFKNTHHTTGHIFESQFKASLIQDEAYIMHISRYIHLNPKDYERWPYSSYLAYLGQTSPQWLRPQALQAIMTDQGVKNYQAFTAEYIPHMNALRTVEA